MDKAKLPYLFLVISLIAFIIFFGNFGIPSLAQMGGPPGIGQFAPIDAFYVLTKANSSLSNSVLTTKLTTDLVASASGKNLGSSLMPWDNIFGLFGNFTQLISSQLSSLGALTISSGGISQNISLQPSGTGKVTIGGDSLVVASLANDPATSSSQAGQIYFNTTTGEFRGFNGIFWQIFSLATPTPTPGPVPILDETTTDIAQNTTSITVGHATNGTNRFLLAFVTTDALHSQIPTYDGIPMTFLDTNGGNQNGRIYQLIAPTSGFHNFELTGLPTNTDIVVGLVSFNNVNQTTPTGTPSHSSGLATSASINISSANNELSVDYLDKGGITVANPSSGQTLIMSNTVQAGIFLFSSIKPGSGTVSTSWSWDTNTDFGLWGISIKPAP